MVEFLETVAAEIEAHVGHAGWDQRPALFALVRAAQFAVDEPATAARLGLDAALGDGWCRSSRTRCPTGRSTRRSPVSRGPTPSPAAR